MATPTILFKRGPAAAILNANLKSGEPGFTTDRSDFYIGSDGTGANQKFFGSARYWTREDGSTAARLRLVDKNGNNSIVLKSPDTLSGVGTYILPDTSTIQNDYFLKVSTGGQLSWASVNTSASFDNAILSGVTTFTGAVDNDANNTFSGIATFLNTTANTLGNADTGSVQFDGGVGINGNVTVGAGFTVVGPAFFSGVSVVGIQTNTNTTDNTLGTTNTGAVQIAGGAAIAKNLTVGAGFSVVGNTHIAGVTTLAGNVVLGDVTTDTITATARFSSGLTPSANATYDVGTGGLAWRNANFSGVGTFATGAIINGVRIGLDGSNEINTTSGDLRLNSASGTTIIDDAVVIQNNLVVNGNVTVGGTTVTLRGQDVLIENKDLILGFTTTTTPNDDTANHAGVAIASTVGTPLSNFGATGINTLPNTYKQLMWFKSGTLGFATDAFAFNYGLAIGTTTMANGVRFAVGSGITMTDTAINATTVTATNGNFTNLSGNLTGTISTATRSQTIDVTENDTLTGSLLFAVGTGATAVLRDDQLTYDSNANLLTTAGNIAVNGGILTTTSATASVFNTGATTVNAFGFASTLGIGSATGTATVNNPTVTLGNATTVNVNGANPTFASSSTGTLTLFNSNITAVNEFGAATALVIGASSGIATINNATLSLPNASTVNVNGANPTLASSSTGTLTLFNGNLTTVNAFGAATSIGIGAATGTATVNNATVTLANATTLNVNGANPTVASSSTGTLTLFNTNLTKVDAFQAASNIVLGATSGVTTVRNSLRITSNLFDSSNSSGSSGQFLTVTGAGIGWTTISGVQAGSISTATRAQTVDVAENDALTGSLLFAVGTGATAVLRDDQLTYDANTNVLTTAGTIAVNGGDVNTTAASATIFNTNATNVGAFGAATSLVLGQTSGVATVRNATFALPNATTVSVDGANPTISGTSTGTLTLFNANLTKVNAFQAATDIVLAATTGITTIRNSLNVNGNVTLGDAAGDTINVIGTATFGQSITGTISTATRSLNVDVTENDTLTGSLLFAVGTGSTAVLRDDQLTYDANTNVLTTAGDIAVNGGDVTTTSATATVFNTGATTVNAFNAATALIMGQTTGVTTVRNKLVVGGNLEVDGNAIQSSTGATVITLNSTDATFANNVVVAGNLTVNGTTTQVNTQELQVYDRTITLGITSGITSTSTSWDLGVMMNYGDAGVAKTAGVIWEYSNKRFQFAATADNPVGSASTTVPQITVATFAPIEIGALWVNDTAGQHAVISYQSAGGVYSGSTAGRYLQDIIVDGGIFA